MKGKITFKRDKWGNQVLTIVSRHGIGEFKDFKYPDHANLYATKALPVPIGWRISLPRSWRTKDIIAGWRPGISFRWLKTRAVKTQQWRFEKHRSTFYNYKTSL